MKTVILCGGFGTRIRDVAEDVPKPMLPIGGLPILWHIMKYYASWGHNDFVLCLGYKAEAIKEFFLTYNEALANDFVLSAGGTGVHLLRTDIPQELLPAMVQLALKVKSGTVSNVTLDSEKLRLKYLHPDYQALRDTVENALESTPPATPAAPPTTRKPAAPTTTAPPGPTQNLADACAYNPAGDQPN